MTTLVLWSSQLTCGCTLQNQTQSILYTPNAQSRYYDLCISLVTVSNSLLLRTNYFLSQFVYELFCCCCCCYLHCKWKIQQIFIVTFPDILYILFLSIPSGQYASQFSNINANSNVNDIKMNSIYFRFILFFFSRCFSFSTITQQTHTHVHTHNIKFGERMRQSLISHWLSAL